MNKLATIGIAVAFALVAFVGPASAMIDTSLDVESNPVTLTSVGYVGGTNDGQGVGTGAVLCENIGGSGSPGIGGACAVGVDDPSGDVTISVADDLAAAFTGFAWRCGADEGVPTGETSGDSVTVDFADVCPGSVDVTVFVNIGGTSGTISTSS